MIRILIFMFSAVMMSTVYAESQDHVSILSTAEAFLKQHVAAHQDGSTQIKMGRLDSRLKLHRCDKAIEAFTPRGSKTIGSTTVGVRCAGSRPWSINIPARVEVIRKVLVSTRLLNRGEQVKAGDLELQDRNVADLPHGYLLDEHASNGLDVKRRIMPGTVVTPSMLKRPKLVKRGQKVNIIASAGSASVQMSGKALAAGAEGDLINVLNASSSRKIQGVVNARGEVIVR